MAETTFTWDAQQLAKVRAALGEQGEKAISRALSKAGRDAIRDMKTASQRAVRFRKRIKVRAILDALPLTFPKGAKSVEDLEWRMDVSGKVFRVSDFPFRQIKRGVSVAINAGRRSVIRSAFVATMRSGHKGVFVRRGKKRLPIDELFTTRVSDVFNDNGMIPAVQAKAMSTFQKTFDRVLPLELAKLG